MTTTGSTPSSGAERASGGGESVVITLPDTVGMSHTEAEAALRAAGVLGELRVTTDGSATPVATDRVCGQVPGGGQQSRSTLVVSLRFCGERQVASKQDLDVSGLTADEATKRVRATGYTGRIEVRPADTSATCQTERVCSITPHHWQDNQPHSIELWVGRSLSINVPD